MERGLLYLFSGVVGLKEGRPECLLSNLITNIGEVDLFIAVGSSVSYHTMWAAMT